MADQNETLVARHYDQLGVTYDAEAAARGWPVHDLLLDAMEGHSAPQDALDLGAGTGLTATAVMDGLQPERLVAVDISTVALAALRAKFDGDARVATEQMTAERYLATTTEQFDLAVAMGLMMYVSDPDAVISGVSRVLRPGGRFVYTYDPIFSDDPPRPVEQAVHDDGVATYSYDRAAMVASIHHHGLEVENHRLFDAMPNMPDGFIAGFVVVLKP